MRLRQAMRHAGTALKLVPLTVTALIVLQGGPMARADIFTVYHDEGLPLHSTVNVWPGGEQGPMDVDHQESPERVRYFETTTQNGSGWGGYAGWGVHFQDPKVSRDLSRFAAGNIVFWVRTAFDLKVEIEPLGSTSYATWMSWHGWDKPNEWQEVSIPVATFGLTDAELGSMHSPFKITTENESTFDVDFIRWTTPLTGYSPSSVTLDDGALLVDGRPFVVKGVAESFTPVGEWGPSYDWSLESTAMSNHYSTDIGHMRDMHANTLRTYDRRPTQSAAFDMLHGHGIRVIMGFHVDATLRNGQLVDLGNDVVRSNIIGRFLDMVEHWKDHPAILMWSVGNELNYVVPDNDADRSDWYSLVDDCAAAAHALEGTSFHPVTTATGDGLSDIGNANRSTDDPSMPHLDVWSLQIYRGKGFGSLFDEYAAASRKPLLITEFGCDAWNTNKGEDERTQKRYIRDQWREIEQHLSPPPSPMQSTTKTSPGRTPRQRCLGGVVFSYRDEWWKSRHGDRWTHNTDSDWKSYGYRKDWHMQEEWWGLVGISSDTTYRQLREGYYLLQRLWE